MDTKPTHASVITSRVLYDNCIISSPFNVLEAAYIIDTHMKSKEIIKFLSQFQDKLKVYTDLNDMIKHYSIFSDYVQYQ